MKRINTSKTIDYVGKQVHLAGWVQKIRNHGKLLFIDLRDWTGIVQLVVDISNSKFQQIESSIGNEYVIEVKGEVVERDSNLINKKITTGNIEVRCEEISILSSSKIVPFPLDTDGKDIDESIRLKYRFLDIRRKRVLDTLKYRAKFIAFIRDWFKSHDFLEVETPLLTSTSPEGARDFIIPSRIHKGKFYVLPQAPQQFKQLLMVGGIEKYFQIAPCFRDEDPRSDRHYGAFYQLDVEMSFVTQEDVFQTVEPFFKDLVETLTTKKIMNYPFPRIPYKEVMEDYGSDKPDLRFDLKLKRMDFLKSETGFNVFNNADCIKGIVVDDNPLFTRKQIDDLAVLTMNAGSKGLAWIKRNEDNTISGPISKFIPDNVIERLEKECDFRKGSILFIVADKESIVNKSLNVLRLHLGDILNLKDKNLIAFAWIVDFPMYEWDENNNKIDFSHNPFSMPVGGLDALNTKNPLEIMAQQYDIIANNLEIASGAIRNHNPETMIKAFEIAGYTRDEVMKRFHHMIDAFSYGVPPHGGFAPGIDRLFMLLNDEPNIREGYAFPMSSDARDLMMGAPSEVSDEQLKEVGLVLDEKTKQILKKKS